MIKILVWSSIKTRGTKPMNRILSVSSFCFLILFVSNYSLSQDNDNRRDGNWWTSLEKEYKLKYLVGFFDGMDLGNRFSYWGMSKTTDAKCSGAVVESYSKYSIKYFSHVTNIQLADGIDTFYSDYRNRRITIDGAVWLVVNGIAGTLQDDLDKMIENWRKNAVPEK
jgi:hypothetical protein